MKKIGRQIHQQSPLLYIHQNFPHQSFVANYYLAKVQPTRSLHHTVTFCIKILSAGNHTAIVGWVLAS